jgi:hypothetical protein
MSLVIYNQKRDTRIWLQTQSIVFTMLQSRFLLQFPSKSKVKDSVVLPTVTRTAIGWTFIAANLSTER